MTFQSFTGQTTDGHINCLTLADAGTRNLNFGDAYQSLVNFDSNNGPERSATHT